MGAIFKKQWTMSTAYKPYIKQVMKYGSNVLVTAQKSYTNKLEAAQNYAFRLISK